MLIDFFYTLRAAKLPVSVKEFLTLLEALQADVVGPRQPDACSIDDFYYLARTALVKDEKHFDKFDRAFAAYFKGVEHIADFRKEIPAEWLRKILEKELTPEQKAAIEKMGWDELMETLKKRLDEQKERHEGGSKWIGTGGTSPFGHGGYNPQGIRIGGKGGNKSAVKVWDQRAYRDYDDSQELGTRNIKVALRRLRKFARTGSEFELDLPDTIRSTAANAGWLDIKMVPERHNAVKVWDQRAYRDYDDTQELGTRNIKVALRRLRKFAREGSAERMRSISWRSQSAGMGLVKSAIISTPLK